MPVVGVILALLVMSGIALIAGHSSTTPSLTQTASAATLISYDAFASTTVAARAAYVFDTKHGALFAKNPAAQLPIASITKIATALVVSERVPGEGTVIISAEAVARGEGGRLAGEEWRARDLLDYMLLTSSNVGAEALAEAAGDTVLSMNELARSLDMHETYFLNPTGLDASPTQAGALSSARDVATLLAYAVRVDPDLFSITRQKSALVGPLHAAAETALNTNDALDLMPGLILGKTGTTDIAGANLALAVEIEGHPVIIVILGSTEDNRFGDALTLIDATSRALRPK